MVVPQEKQCDVLVVCSVCVLGKGRVTKKQLPLQDKNYDDEKTTDSKGFLETLTNPF